MNHLFVNKFIIALNFGLFLGFHAFSQEGNITIQQDPKIAQLMELQAEMAQDNDFGERYKIQIFYGNNGQATAVLKEFHEKYPEFPTTIEYQTPNYKVWIGDFRNRLEADRAFLRIKDEYQSAFIFKPNGG
ncbi:MAG TPA: SPOR domain-containing protein [Flavobacteriaceae bacterium]|nr:SPOR domain-containing protein [Flavobacteriaceae bacterium]